MRLSVCPQLERTEFYALVHNVATVLNGSNKLPWVLCVQPLMALLLAAALWLPAFIAVLAVQVDDNSGSKSGVFDGDP